MRMTVIKISMNDPTNVTRGIPLCKLSHTHYELVVIMAVYAHSRHQKQGVIRKK